MNRSALLSIGAIILSSTATAQLAYDFDTDNQGWRRANLNPSSLELTVLGPASWNAGGFIDADDFSNWAFHLSPDLSGGFAGATSIQFDYSSLSGDAVYPLVVLRGQGEAIFQSLQVPADNSWHHYNYNLVPGTWLYSNGGAPALANASQIDAVLTNLFQIGVSADNSVGPEYTRLDNVMVVPEPTTMIVLGFGATALFRRRKCGVQKRITS